MAVATLFTEWRSFERDVVPANAPPVQREECRRAFYAGAAAMRKAVFDAVDDRDDTRCEDNLKRLDDEIAAFRWDLRIERR